MKRATDQCSPSTFLEGVGDLRLGRSIRALHPHILGAICKAPRLPCTESSNLADVHCQALESRSVCDPSAQELHLKLMRFVN